MGSTPIYLLLISGYCNRLSRFPYQFVLRYTATRLLDRPHAHGLENRLLRDIDRHNTQALALR